MRFSRLIFFFEKFFPRPEIIRVSNSLDPDQARLFVRPDLGPNCCKSYQQTTQVGKKLTPESDQNTKV